MLVDVDRSNVADSYEALVAVPCVALASHVLASDKPLKGLLRQYAAHLLLALTGATGLLHLRRVDAVEPDFGFAYVDGVAVDYAGLARDVGVGMGWEREEE